MGSINNNYGYTPDGNYYEKSTKGQKIGKFLGAAPGSAAAAVGAGVSIFSLVKKSAAGTASGGITLAIGAGVAILGGIIGKAIGGLFDRSKNKEIATDVDGRNKLEKHTDELLQESKEEVARAEKLLAKSDAATKEESSKED